METRNITFHLPSALIRQAKAYAAAHDTSVNTLVRELLEQKLNSRDQTRDVVKRLLELAEQGLQTNVDPGSIRREELYERW